MDSRGLRSSVKAARAFNSCSTFQNRRLSTSFLDLRLRVKLRSVGERFTRIPRARRGFASAVCNARPVDRGDPVPLCDSAVGQPAFSRRRISFSITRGGARRPTHPAIVSAFRLWPWTLEALTRSFGIAFFGILTIRERRPLFCIR